MPTGSLVKPWGGEATPTTSCTAPLGPFRCAATLFLQDLNIENYFKTILNQTKYPEGRILFENLPQKT